LSGLPANFVCLVRDRRRRVIFLRGFPLNTEAPNGNAAARLIVSLLFGAGISACGLFLLYFVYRQPADLFGGELQLAEALLSVAKAWSWALALCVLSVLVHEAGHAIAAWRCGMTIISIRVWPLDWWHRRRGMRPRRGH
jgi:hypothetical protein